MKYAFCLIGLLLLAGCPDDNATAPDRPRVSPVLPTEFRYLPRTSPENLVANVQRAYEFRDVAAFERQLADDYAFYFCSRDTIHFGSALSRAEDIIIHSRMFGYEGVEVLTAMLTIGEVSVDLERTTAEDTVWTAETTVEDLYLFGRNPILPYDDAQGWKLSGTCYEVFRFRRSGELDPKSSAPLWEIVAWEEFDIYGHRTHVRLDPCPMEGSSWGGIRTLFDVPG